MTLVFNYDKDFPKPSPLRANYLREQVKFLKNIHQPVQKSPEWYAFRDTMITASDFGSILGDNPYSKSDTILLRKCGEPAYFPSKALEAMNFGNKYEDVAVLVYEYRNKVDIIDFGCLKHPSIDHLGASPDGITSNGVMLEIKCPTSRQITGEPPAYYWCQVQGQLEVAELDRCDFIECNFKEYENEEQYYADNYNGDYFLNKFGNEKGVIAEFFKKSDKTTIYKYAPVGIKDEALENWKTHIVKETSTNDLVIFCFSFWYLEVVSCVPIYRDQEWFNSSKGELEFFWKSVMKYRALGLDKLKEDLSAFKVLKNGPKKETSNKRSIKDTKDSKKQKTIRDFINLNDIGDETIPKNKDKDKDDEYGQETELDLQLSEDIFLSNNSFFS
jgi:putative phage-type endonuclease